MTTRKSAEPAPGDVVAPDVAPIDQGKAEKPNPTPDSTDTGAAARSEVDLKRFVKSQKAPSDLYLVLDDVNGEHYFSDHAPAGKGAQLLALEGQPVDEGISLRIEAVVPKKK